MLFASCVAESRISWACLLAALIVSFACAYAFCMISCCVTSSCAFVCASAIRLSALDCASSRIASLLLIIFWYFLISSGVRWRSSTKRSSNCALSTTIFVLENGWSLQPSINSSISPINCSILLILIFSFISDVISNVCFFTFIYCYFFVQTFAW